MKRQPNAKLHTSGASSRSPADQQIAAAGDWRFLLVLLVLAGCFAALAWRAVDLQVIDQEFLSGQGDLRTIRFEDIPATRGKILDRHGEPLAVSAPVVTLWANPQQVDLTNPGWSALAELLGDDVGELKERLGQNFEREFIYIQRQMAPELADAAMQLSLEGLYSQRDFKRYYPAGEVAAHVVGMTDIDEKGQEGVELVFDQYLQDTPGKKKVLKDRRGFVVQDLSLISDAIPGEDLQLSIDLRLQYLAYRELKAVVEAHQAHSASLVLLDVKTGEVLAMVNQPSYNPNNRGSIQAAALRNRAITDLFEPGSTMKPFSIAAALGSGKFSVNSVVDTSPGYLRLNGRTIRDHRNYGKLSLTKVVVKSSNVGTSRIAFKVGGESIWETFFNAGFGQATGIEYPGEAVGSLPNYSNWKPVRLATLSYGYGLSTTTLQLAQAYMAIASGGIRHPVSLIKGGQKGLSSQRVMSEEVATSLKNILEQVVLQGGTGTRAHVSEYRVAGKTGTVHNISAGGGYAEDDYTSVFAGLAPVENSRLAMVVAVNGPQSGEYYGGEVSAPVFSRVMANSLRLLNVAPDIHPGLMASASKKAERGG
ncbi:peptidoglycan D,D-transpeptidase FtsI family protein [Hahella ganghwensis]|uniref:peptidoglycan D,D-transpeptidase FtsI family protein n=1 Tax=Hahella ganghwensis TaxID=286420 RepID=UPI0003762058|nr:penicillin-binding transpeptidase domain-containing protein [Hahella ganghwensis]